MNRHRFVRLAVIALFASLGLSAALYAQERATLVGTVTDPSGGVVPAVKVTVTSTDTSVSRTAETNSAGSYSVPDLNPGNYSVHAEIQGFRSYERTGVILHVNDTLRVDIQLQVGEVTQSVTVSEAAVRIQTESAEVSDTVVGKQVQSIAINGGNFLALTALVPGASSLLPDFNLPIPVGSSFSISFNGQRTHHNYFMIDGGENYDRGCGGCITILPNREAIQEFKIQTANSGADFGLGSGATVNIGIKSGTHDFHGELYEFFRNDRIDASNFFNNAANQPKPKLRFNNFGWQLGGPFYLPGKYNTDKRKTFFFFSQEWRRLRQGTTINAPAIPGPERVGDFSKELTGLKDANGNDTGAIFVPQPLPGQTLPPGLVPGQPFPGNIIPSSLVDSNATILGSVSTGLLPLPNSPDGKFFTAAPSVPTDDREEIVRVDQTITDKLQLMFHFINEAPNFQEPTSLWTNSTYPTVGTAFRNPAKSAVLKLTWALNPTLVNEVSFSWDANRIDLSPTGKFAAPSGLKGAGDVFPGNALNRFPGLEFSGPRFNTAISVGFQPWHNANDNYILRDQANKITGNHQLTFGGLVMFSTKPQDLFGTTQGTFTFNGDSTKAPYAGGSSGNEFADFLLGRAFKYNELALQDRGHWRFWSYSLWAADNWHVSRRLTVNLGARWEVLPHTFENFDRQSTFRPDAFDPAQAQSPNPVTGQLNPNGPGFQTVPNVPLNVVIPGIRFYTNGIGLAGKNGIPRGLVDNHYDTIGPRVGFAYDLLGDGKTVLRAGYGEYFERIQGNDVYNAGPNTPFSFNPTVFNTTLTNPGGGGIPIFPASIVALSREYLAPTTAQFNAGIQRELFPNAVLSLEYVGTTGRHLRIQRNINQPFLNNSQRGKVDPNLIRPFPGFSDITYGENSTSSSYNSLQANLRINNYHGLTFQTAYTWSHEIDIASGDFGTVGNAANNQGTVEDAYNYNLDRGNGDLDRRHALIINYIYDLPIPGRNSSSRFYRQFLGGWEISGVTSFQSGTPISITVAGDPAGIGSTVRANVIGDPNNGPKSASQWFNVGAFAPVGPVGVSGSTGFGNSGRNIVRLPGRNNWDISLFKSFGGIPFPGTKEGVSLQYRLEFFNAFNHTQFNQVFSVFGQTGFGAPSSAHDPRIIQMGLRFTF